MINPKRDQLAAEGAVRVAAKRSLRVALEVDDDICLEAMLPRVTSLLDERRLQYEVARPSSGVVEVRIAVSAGTVVIIAADRLTGKPGN